jgi:hypothetical protein
MTPLPIQVTPDDNLERRSSISAVELNHKSDNRFRPLPADLAITGDAEATLPELIEA